MTHTDKGCIDWLPVSRISMEGPAGTLGTLSYIHEPGIM